MCVNDRINNSVCVSIVVGPHPRAALLRACGARPSAAGSFVGPARCCMRHPVPLKTVHRRTTLMAVTAAITSLVQQSTAQASLDTAMIALEQERDLCAADIELEGRLEALLSTRPVSDAAVEALVASLERSRGRQQRAGWGISDSRWDLPFIGSWDVLYPVPSLAAGLVSGTRQWVYGPGDGGVAVECILSSAGPSDAHSPRSVLVTHSGAVTKGEGAQVRLDMDAGGARAFSLVYSAARATRRQSADGSWATVETRVPLSEPAVGTPLSGPDGAGAKAMCAPTASGLVRTAYLSDTLWVVRPTHAEAGDPSAAGAPVVLRRTAAEALRPQNGGVESPDGFDARRFGPSGRRIWMMDTSLAGEKESSLERARQRMRSADEISAS